MGNEVEAAPNAFAITFNGRITPTGHSTNAKVGSTVNQTVPSGSRSEDRDMKRNLGTYRQQRRPAARAVEGRVTTFLCR